jgi:hypothetical protein
VQRLCAAHSQACRKKATSRTPPVTWQTLQTIDGNFDDVIQINDPALTNTARFYRVLAQ